MSKLERIMTFHGWVKKTEFPNLTDLQECFEVSRSTAARDVEYMRDRLAAPLEYDRGRRGYYYSAENFCMPFEENQNALVFAALLNKIAEQTGLDGIKEVQRIKEALGRRLFERSRQTLNHISCEFVEIEPPPAQILMRILDSLDQNRDFRIRYRDVKDEETCRDIRPLRLHGYQGQWYLAAFCFLRERLRLFHTARILKLTPLSSRKDLPQNLDVDSYLDSSYGIFKGNALQEVKIKFSGVAANIVRNQRWHRDQVITETENGIIMSLPVADFQEVKMKVLKFGSGAQVLEPQKFRQDIEQEIRAMSDLYVQR